MDSEAKLPVETKLKRQQVAEILPFPAIRYLAGECNYGGRVTDANDRRTLLTILEDFYNPTLIDDFGEANVNNVNSYQFSVLSESYSMPPMGWLTNNKDYIKNELPLSDDGPEMYGLHSNANISCALQETTALLETALSLQPQDAAGSSGGGGQTWDAQVANLSSAIEARVPTSSKAWDVSLVALKYPVMYEESMNTVLQQELLRFNTLLDVVNSTLIELQKAIQGLVLLSADLEQMGTSMVEGSVPTMWKTYSYPSLKPLGGWVNDLIARIEFFQLWIDQNSPPVFWLPGFFFTQSFITGTRQNHARRSSIPIDEIDYDFQVLTAKVDRLTWIKPQAGCYVHGLFLQGAAWDTNGSNRLRDATYGQGTLGLDSGSTGEGSLVESTPKELFVSMPVIWFWPRKIADIPVPLESLGGTAHVYICPVYKTSARRGMLSTTGHSTNFVIAVRLPVGKTRNHSHWIKRGVAMLSATD